jgi:hypothetical protein
MHEEYFYRNCTLNSNPDKGLRGYIDGTITGYGGMPDNPTRDEVIIYREKPEYAERKKQLRINMLGLVGGRPYVNARLSRFAGETEIDWIGGQRPDGSCSTGRLQQTHAFPYLGRIDGKINQYVFSKEPVREDADLETIKDITRDGKSVNDVMRKASSLAFACKWCWIGIDAPARKEDGTEYTQAEKEELKITPYWQVYSPLEVMDWYFDERGELEWIKTVGVEYDDADPSSVPQPKKVIKLWTKGLCTKYTIIEKRDARFRTNMRIDYEVEEIPLTLTDRIPFVLVGDTSAKPIAFDDLESINRTIMDLESVNRANFFNACYPQLVIPASIMQRGQQDGYLSNASDIGRLLIGFKYPIQLEKDDPAPFYLTPDASALGSIREELGSLKRNMFEVVGLALEQESRQVASAEAKAWDFMDVSAVMKSRAEMLQDAESKCVEISKAWDFDFQEWTPVYNTDFDIGNFKDEITALVMAGNMPMPKEVMQEVIKKLVDRFDRIGSPIDDERKAELTAAIENWDANAAFSLVEPSPEEG